MDVITLHKRTWNGQTTLERQIHAIPSVGGAAPPQILTVRSEPAIQTSGTLAQEPRHGRFFI